MRSKRKTISIILVFAALVSLCACTNNEEPAAPSPSDAETESVLQEEFTTEHTSVSSTGSSSSKPSEPTSFAPPAQSPTKSASSTEASSAYTPRPKNPETLSADTEEKIKADYAKWENRKHWLSKIEAYNVMIDDYLGTYGGGEVVCITVTERAYLPVIVEENIAGYTLRFPSSAPYYFHKGTKFYSLEDAYAKGLLAKQDIQDIQWYLEK